MASAFLELQLSAALGGGLVLQLYYFQCNEWAMAAEIFFVFSRTQARLHSVDKAVLVRNVQHDFACNLRIHIASLRSCKLNVVPYVFIE